MNGQPVDAQFNVGQEKKKHSAARSACALERGHWGRPRDYSDPEVQRLVKARDLNDVPLQTTMADALFNVSFLNASLRHAEDVAMANIAPIVNIRGPLYVHPEGIVNLRFLWALWS